MQELRLFKMMTIAQYAEHRKRTGQSATTRQAVYNAVKAGRITLIDGKIDSRLADESMRASAQSIYTPANAGGRPKKDGSPAAISPKRQKRELIDGEVLQSEEKPLSNPQLAPPIRKKMSLLEAKTLKESGLAQLTILDLKERKGELVNTSRVKEIFMKAMSIISTGLDGLPGRLAGNLSGMNDPAEIRGLLLKEFREIRRQAASEIDVLVGNNND